MAYNSILIASATILAAFSIENALGEDEVHVSIQAEMEPGFVW